MQEKEKRYYKQKKKKKNTCRYLKTGVCGGACEI